MTPSWEEEEELKEPPLPADDDNHIGDKGKNYNKNGGFVDYEQESKRKMTAMIMAEAGGEEKEFDDNCIANNYTTQSAKLQREGQKHLSRHKKVHTNYLTGMTTIMTIATRRPEECPLRKSN